MLKKLKIKKSSVPILIMKWSVWLFPVFALILAGMLFYDHYQNRGPVIKINFQDAAGIEAGKTNLRFRGILVGTVEDVQLTDDAKKVVVMARMNRDAALLAVDGSTFTIVQPKVNFGGISGLETLFKGPYIRVDRGHGSAKTNFDGVTGDEANDNVGYVVYTLQTNLSESIDTGDPVTYRGLKIGAVSNVKFNSTAEGVDIQISVEHKYAKLIRKNTVFWQKVGVQAKMGIFGGEIKINSLESLLKSGIGLATPNEAGPVAGMHSKFGLQKDAPKDWLAWTPKL